MDEIEVDRLRNLPESLLIQILLKLPTKDVVKTSVLSTKWRNLWRYVPGLELHRSDFSNLNDVVSFVDRFLRFNSDSPMQSFKYYSLKIQEIAHVMRWISIVVERKVKHIHFQDGWFGDIIEIPSTLFTCESLVSLTLGDLDLPCPEFVALPSLKVMHLIRLRFDDSLVLEKLLSNSPVLESLSIRNSFSCDSELLLVRSHSLLSFVYANNYFEVVEIDAPSLEYLCIHNHERNIFILDNPASLVKVDINIVFNLRSGKKFEPDDELKRSIIRKFLLGISSVKEMIISSSTLEVIFAYSRCEPLPLFRNLAFLHVKFFDYRWTLLPFILESCPNLKSLVVGFDISGEWASMDSDPGSRCSLASQLYKLVHGSRCSQASQLFPGSRCSLASLEYVEIKWQPEVDEKVTKLLGYLLLMSTNLKKLTLTSNDFEESEDESFILEELNAIPRVSSICQFAVRPYYSKY